MSATKLRDLLRRRGLIALLLACLLVGIGGYLLWGHYGAPTRIALVNFPGYMSSGIIRSNDSRHISYDELEQTELDKLEDYDCVLTFGMGLKWTAEDRAKIAEQGKHGAKHLVLFATTDENNINTLGSKEGKRISEYFVAIRPTTAHWPATSAATWMPSAGSPPSRTA